MLKLGHLEAIHFPKEFFFYVYLAEGGGGGKVSSQVLASSMLPFCLSLACE